MPQNRISSHMRAKLRRRHALLHLIDGQGNDKAEPVKYVRNYANKLADDLAATGASVNAGSLIVNHSSVNLLEARRSR
jgi:hypothetical protein